ncbi:MAG: hypothetical protein IJ097_02995 [Bacilli bacterium]|nr:hypothetical protein [Bacilli bacterium]
MKKKICLLLVMILSLVAIPVNAEELNNFIADNSANVEEEKSATTFVAGNSVKLSSDIDGIGFAAGNIVYVSSKQDYLFTAGNNVTLDGVSTKDAFVAGNFITVEASEIRDLYVAGTNIIINSDITRNAYIAGSDVVINSKINGDLNLDCENIELGKDAEITGKLIYPSDAKIEISKDAKVGEKETYKSNTNSVKVEISPVSIFITKLLSAGYRFIAMLIIGLILIACNKELFAKIAKKEKSFGKIALTALLGFAFLILLPIAAVILMITVVGIPLSIVSLIVYGLLVYLSIIPTTYYFGNLVFGKSIKNKYGIFTLSLLIIYLIRIIPIIGGLVGFISLIFGLGMYTILFKDKITEKK